jgi:uncharacterized protein
MQFHRDFSHSHYTIRWYGPGQVTLLVPGEVRTAQGMPQNVPQQNVPQQVEVLTRSAVILPHRVVKDWSPQRMDDATLADFQAIAALEPEIVLLGSGRGLRFPPSGLLRPLRERGIGVEVMDTGAACRTYNILVTEGRLVAAALLMIETE